MDETGESLQHRIGSVAFGIAWVLEPLLSRDYLNSSLIRKKLEKETKKKKRIAQQSESVVRLSKLVYFSQILISLQRRGNYVQMQLYALKKKWKRWKNR